MIHYFLPFTVVLSAIAVLVWIYRKISDNAHGKKRPPGPPPTFLVGHTFQIPLIRPWTYFRQLGDLYGTTTVCLAVEEFYRHVFLGPMIHLSLAGDEVLVLNDAKDANELVSPMNELSDYPSPFSTQSFDS